MTRFFFSVLTFLLITGPGAIAQGGRDMIYLDNGILRAGFQMSYGGGLAWLSEGRSGRNLMNAFDPGRLMQQSYYGDEDGSFWGKKPWRYNPVQGGDYQKNGATVLWHRTENGRFYCVSRPRHWAGLGDLPECTMEQWVELVGDMVRARFRFQYQGRKTHQPWAQEVPALFVDASLDTLVSYTGEKPWTGGELSEMKPGKSNENVRMRENWAAWINSSTGRGLGIYTPKSVSGTTYRYRGVPGTECSYIAPLTKFALTPGKEHVYDVWLTVGTANQIRAKFTALRKNGNVPTQAMTNPPAREVAQPGVQFEKVPRALPVNPGRSPHAQPRREREERQPFLERFFRR